MNFDPSLPHDNRRDFVKKSLAASIIAAQPTLLAGLLRAQGGGGGTGTTDPWDSTVDLVYGGTGLWETTSDYSFTSTTTTEEERDVYHAKIVGAGKIPVVGRSNFQIGDDWYSLELVYKVSLLNSQNYANGYWNSAAYLTWFEAYLKKKMSHDPEAGPYTGAVTSTSSSVTAARSETRRIDAYCAPEDGEMSGIGQILHPVSANYVARRPVKYSIGGEIYRVEISGVNEGAIEDGGSTLTTWDKGEARVLVGDRPAEEGYTPPDLASVTAFEFFLGDEHHGCYVQSASSVKN
jgi:hypothetical protein